MIFQTLGPKFYLACDQPLKYYMHEARTCRHLYKTLLVNDKISTTSMHLILFIYICMFYSIVDLRTNFPDLTINVCLYLNGTHLNHSLTELLIKP